MVPRSAGSARQQRSPGSSEGRSHRLPFAVAGALWTCSHYASAHTRGWHRTAEASRATQRMARKTTWCLLTGPGQEATWPDWRPWGHSILPLSRFRQTPTFTHCINCAQNPPLLKKGAEDKLVFGQGTRVYCDPGDVAAGRANLSSTASLPDSENTGNYSKENAPSAPLVNS